MTTAAVRENVTIAFPIGLELTGALVHEEELSLLELVTDEGPERLSISLTAYGREPDDGCVFIKGWSEHEGLAESLEEQGLVEIVDRMIVGPFGSTAYEARVLLD